MEQQQGKQGKVTASPIHVEHLLSFFGAVSPQHPEGLQVALHYTTSYALFYNQVSALLAARAKVRGPLRHNHAADGSFAGDAGFAGALVDAMAELKEAFSDFGIDML